MATLSFVDSGGSNPLPPGIIVTLTTSGTFVASGMLQAGGVMPAQVQASTYVASFVGTQAPLMPVTLTSTGVGTTIVTVPNYASPCYSAVGYAIEAAYALVLYWHDVTLNTGYSGP